MSLLPPVHGLEVHLDAVDVRPPAPAGVAQRRALHLDHAGAELGEQQRAVRAREGVREVEHVDAVERARGLRGQLTASRRSRMNVEQLLGHRAHELDLVGVDGEVAEVLQAQDVGAVAQQRDHTAEGEPELVQDLARGRRPRMGQRQVGVDDGDAEPADGAQLGPDGVVQVGPGFVDHEEGHAEVGPHTGLDAARRRSFERLARAERSGSSCAS